jgi:hypothetical protein
VIFGVLSSLFTALVYLLDRDSNTMFKVTGADNLHIYVKAWNTGRQPSTLVQYTLLVEGKLPMRNIPLDLSKADRREGKNVIASKEPVKIALSVKDLNWLPKPDHPEGFTATEFDDFKDRLVTLRIDIEESNDSDAHWSDTFPADRIRDFLCGGCG